ncbi:hypothetical protein IV203_032481 [Nitzschia inconspicua]|uniref:Uncharacterized protein n=1 Tax=Nitzschia inconspicua TaxID=303405 RepID=A0A9K3PF30_9STRA|nr:hypothetical protein IV203_032481 [Nitzschia inconspicua]
MSRKRLTTSRNHGQQQQKPVHRKFRSKVDIPEEKSSDQSVVELLSYKHGQKRSEPKTIVLEEKSESDNDGSNDDDDSSLEVPYAMNLSQPAGPILNNSRKRSRTSTYDSLFHSDTSSFDTDSDDDTSIGYQSPPPSSQQEQLRNPKENIRPGDVIDYQNTILAVAGSSQARGRAVVLATRPGNTQYPLMLHNGAVLPASTPIQRVAEYRDGTLYPHHGQIKPISKFRMKDRQIDNRNGEQVTFATGLLQQAERLKQLKQTVEQQAVKFLRGDADHKLHHGKAKRNADTNAADCEMLDWSSDSDSLLETSIAQKRNDTSGQTPSSFSPPSFALSKHNVATTATNHKCDASGGSNYITRQSAAIISEKGDDQKDNETAAALLQLRKSRSHPAKSSDNGLHNLGCSSKTTREPPIDEHHLLGNEILQLQSNLKYRHDVTYSDPNVTSSTSGTVRRKQMNKRVRDEFDSDSSSDEEVAFRSTMPTYHRSKTENVTGANTGLVGSPISTQRLKRSASRKTDKSTPTPKSGRSNGLGYTVDLGDDSDSTGSGIGSDRRFNDSQNSTPSTKPKSSKLRSDGSSSSIFKLKKQNHNGKNSGNKNLTDSTCQDDSSDDPCQNFKQKPTKRSCVADQSHATRYQPLMIVESMVGERLGGLKTGTVKTNSPQSLMKAYKRLEKRKQRQQQKLQNENLLNECKAKTSRQSVKQNKLNKAFSKKDSCCKHRNSSSTKAMESARKSRVHKVPDSSNASSSPLQVPTRPRRNPNHPSSSTKPPFPHGQTKSDEKLEWNKNENCEGNNERLLAVAQPILHTSSKTTFGRFAPDNDNALVALTNEGSVLHSYNENKSNDGQSRKRAHRSSNYGSFDHEVPFAIDLTSSPQSCVASSRRDGDTKPDEIKNDSPNGRISRSQMHSCKKSGSPKQHHEITTGVPHRFDLSSSSDDDHASASDKANTSNMSFKHTTDDPRRTSAFSSRHRRKTSQIPSSSRSTKSRWADNDLDVFDYKSSDENYNPQPLSRRKRKLSPTFNFDATT